MDQTPAPNNPSAASAPPPYPPPQQIIIQQPSTMFGRFGKWLLLALVLMIMVAVSMYGTYQSYFSPADMPQEKYHSLSKSALKKIAIIDISGPIFAGEDSFAKRQIDRVREDDSVVALVARINSPGGTVTGSDYIYHHLRELAEERQLPLVVSMGSVCASGGYYIAMAVGDRSDSIFAEPTTWTGSIGVIIPHYDLSASISALRIRDDSIVSGRYKDIGSPTKPMTPPERKLLQGLVDESFAGFKEVVMSGRPKFKEDPTALDEIAQGQIFTAKQAAEHGLIDKIGFIEEAVERAAELAGVSTDKVRCVHYKQPPTMLGELLGADAGAPRGGRADLAALLDLTVPRAYYLWTWLPAAMSNTR